MSKKVALVTGSASGIGVQTVHSLAELGYDIAINYRKSEHKAIELKKRIESKGVNCLLLQGDVAQKSDCIRMVQEAKAVFQRIDILVLNAGPYVFDRKKMADYTDEEWELLIHGNLSSSFYLVREVIPSMREQKWGRIITFGFNQAGQAAGWKYRSVFAAAKVALVSLTKSLAEEESENGITVNMICPGDIVKENKEKKIQEVISEDLLQSAPIGRPGAGEDVSRVVKFLCLHESDFITGSVIEVNGGFNVLAKREKGKKINK